MGGLGGSPAGGLTWPRREQFPAPTPTLPHPPSAPGQAACAPSVLGPLGPLGVLGEPDRCRRPGRPGRGPAPARTAGGARGSVAAVVATTLPPESADRSPEPGPASACFWNKVLLEPSHCLTRRWQLLQLRSCDRGCTAHKAETHRLALDRRFADLALGRVTGSMTPRTKEGTVRLCLAGQALPKAMVVTSSPSSEPGVDGAVTTQSSALGGRQQIDEGQTAKGNDRRAQASSGRGLRTLAGSPAPRPGRGVLGTGRVGSKPGASCSSRLRVSA